MTSLDTAQYHTFETAPGTYERPAYGLDIPSRSGPLFTGLDKIAYALVAFMGLAPLAMAAFGAHLFGTAG